MTWAREDVEPTRDYLFLFQGVVIAQSRFGSLHIVVCDHQDRFEKGSRYLVFAGRR